MGLAIKIKKADDGNLCAVGNDAALFEFRYEPEAKAWLFFARGGIRKKFEQRGFPWVFFYDFCRTIAFLQLDEPLWTSAATIIVSGKSYIK